MLLMKIFIKLVICTFFFAPVLMAADLVTVTTTVQDEIEDDVTVSVNGGAKVYRPHTTIPGGGDGTTSSQPYVTYLAYQNSVKSSTWQYFTLGDGVDNDNGPLFIGSASGGVQSLTLPVKIDSDGRRSLFVAVKDTSDTSGASWVVIKKIDRVTTSAENDLETSISFDPNSICLTYLSSQCSTLANGTQDRQTFNLFLFLADNGDSDSDITLSSVIDADDYSGKGLYWDLKLSARIPSFSSGVAEINEARRGDLRILLDYSLPTTINDIKEIVVIYKVQNSDPTPATTNLFSDIAGSQTNEIVSFDDYGSALTGTISIKNLVNNNIYQAYLGVVDLYYFAPAFSDVASQRTSAIEALLKEESCFFLTAGFGEEHKVIRGFRKFRDRILLKTLSGKIFVNAYYKIGPILAPKIYQSEKMRYLIRAWSSTVYWVATNLLWIFLSIFAVLLALSVVNRKRFRLSFF